MKVKVEDLQIEISGTVKMEVRIGDYQPGSHIWEGGIKPDNYPPPDRTVWSTKLRNADDSYIRFTSATINRNPDTNWVSVDIFINGTPLEHPDLEKKVDQNTLVEFDITIHFT